ncbi:MAG: DUF2975 domain-containing protein [Gammaproteobacteria bacterium]|nr:MAG: DUF2975 domain-containing protein [Gammaproteobacteria bacterium]UTW42044.1 DUF2975 domain-containing protein [bacterium SCSIO 12844]
MINITTTSHRYRIIFQALFYITVIGFILFWLTYQTPYDIFSPFGVATQLSNLAQSPLTPLTRFLAFFVSMIPCLIILYGLYQLIKLFKNYEKGDVFSIKNVLCYRKLCYTLFAWVIGGLIYDPLMSLVLTFNNPPGHRVISISFGSSDIVALIAGAIVLIIAHIMYQAHQISNENQLTI